MICYKNMKGIKINMKKKAWIYTIFIAVCIFVTGSNVNCVRAENVARIIACSDFQNPNGNEEGKTFVRSVLSKMEQDGVTIANGLLCCGDYDYEYTETAEGINALKEATSGMVNDNFVFVQGNHDSAIGTAGISDSGDNDPEDGQYGVFVINEDDYMWYNNDEARIKRTAQNLIDYMNDKIKSAYDKPIFVLSHLPLHYSMRTKNDGDGMYAKYIFDVLNKAGEKGLNIIFLFGHDHSNGWDDYIGGSSIYLKKSDDILIANYSKTDFTTEKLNFTYMNAGYTGYYGNVNGADDTLTMTLFDILEDEMSISRYGANGIHKLKSAGVRNTHANETGYEPNTEEYLSPQRVPLTSVTDYHPIEDLIEKPDIINNDYYKRVTDMTELKDGGHYLLVCKDYEGNMRIMLPQSEEINSRVGFKTEITTAFGLDIVLGEYTDKEWIFTKTDNGWRLGNGTKYAALTNTSSKKITATFEDNASEFTMGGSADNYTFTSGAYVLTYNTRGIVNGYENDPAHFYIYEFTEKEKPSAKITNTTKTDTGIRGTIQMNYVPVGISMIVAGYKNDCLVDIDIITSDEKVAENFELSSDIENIKIFLFESLNTIKPIAPVTMYAMNPDTGIVQ